MARRSVLFSPGDRPDMLRKAPGTGADVICFDLEDAVAPDRRDAARRAVREVLVDEAFDPASEVWVRVGADPAADVAAVVDGAVRLDAVVVPKVEHASDVGAVAGLLDDAGRSVPVVALVETARGVLAAESIADAPATDAVGFGAEDLAADVGSTPSPERSEVSYARQHVLVAARAAGIEAIDAVYVDFEDEAGLRADTEAARDLGYDGKMAIHPAQVDVINDAFTPDPERVEWAERVVAARDAARREGRSAFEVDGEMVDPPLVEQAERVLARARAADGDRT
jgi:citrate lyase subunit beta/citryl-CoA lyase